MKSDALWATLHPFYEAGGVLGRGVANEGFLNALLRANPYAGYHFFLADSGQVASVRERLKERFPRLWEAGALSITTRHELPEALRTRRYACFHLSDCVAEFAPLIRLRNAILSERFSGEALRQHFFPVTGPTHSLSYARYAPYFFGHMWNGITRRDAVIVTSHAARGVMERYQAAFCRGYGLDAALFSAPRLERIPLGVAPEEFPAPEEKAALASKARMRYALPEGRLVFLVFARLSHYSKMDVIPLLKALARAEGQGLRPSGYSVILSGWAEPGEATAGVYANLARAQGIDLRVIPSPSNEERKSLFALADIFVSPVDNPQETFGLSLLEAGASSLPVIASDYDGYRDLVEHGTTGFLIPTYGPAVTPESDVLSGVWFDNQYHLQIAQQSVVDVPALASALALLAGNEALRRAMGAAARQKALTYRWENIIAAHVALWDALGREEIPEQLGIAHPLHPGFTEIFGGYYTHLASSTALSGVRLQWSRSGQALYRGREHPVLYGGVSRLVDSEALRRLLFTARRPVALEDLLPPSGESHRADYEQRAFLVFWAWKQDFLEQVPE